MSATMSRLTPLKLFQQTSRRAYLQSHITPLSSRPSSLNPLSRPYTLNHSIPLTSQALRFQQVHQTASPFPSSTPSPCRTPASTPIQSRTPPSRSFSSTTVNEKGLSPESENPQPKEAEDNEIVPKEPADIGTEKYHELADEYMNALVEKLEQLQEEDEDVDCEYSAGVLTLTFPPAGTYVINKQPPNKQIWLSSPTTGPKRYDYVMLSEGQNAKEGTGKGEWVYLRDGSLLTDLLEKEIGVDMNNLYAPVLHRGD